MHHPDHNNYNNNNRHRVDITIWNGDRARTIMLIDEQIRHRQRGRRGIHTNKDLDKLLGVPTVNMPLSERVRRDFLQTDTTHIHQFAPRGRECRPSLVPIDMADPALANMGPIEHGAYVVPPLGKGAIVVKKPATDAGIFKDYIHSFSMTTADATRDRLKRSRKRRRQAKRKRKTRKTRTQTQTQTQEDEE